MKLIKYIPVLVPCIALIMASCSDDNPYEPGAPDAADCMGVYFDPDNVADFLFIPGADCNINVVMHREKTTDTADVPLEVKANVEGVKAPASVHFDAGSANATVVLDCSAMPSKTPAVITVGVPDKYTNHYAETLFNYQATAIMSQWEKANLDGSPVTVWFTSTDYISSRNPQVVPAVYEPIECDMEVLPGAGRMRLHNFLNTGLTQEFEITQSPYADYSSFYRLSPLNNNYSLAEAYESDTYGDSWFNAWFLYDYSLEDGEGDYVDCALTNLAGNPSVLTYPYLFWYSDSYAAEYAYMNPKSASIPHNNAVIGLAGSPDDDTVVIPAYFYIYFNWDGESGI